MNMLERLVETFCEVDDFYQAFMPQWEAYLLGTSSVPGGPQPGLCVSEITRILLMLHSSQYLKSFYQGHSTERKSNGRLVSSDFQLRPAIRLSYRSLSAVALGLSVF